MNTISFNAMKKWNKIPPDIQQRIINNVFCSKCKDTTIINYTIEDTDLGALLKGECKKCSKKVTRLVEDA